MIQNVLEMLNILAQTIYKKKGVNILAMDVRETSLCTDFLLIAEGSVERHVQALSRALIEKIGKLEEAPIHVEGAAEGSWIVIDCHEILVHLMTPELRKKYALEQLWKAGAIVDLKLETEDSASPLHSEDYSDL